MATAKSDPSQSNGDLPAAAVLFEAANRMRGSVESAEYKHLVLGLLFLKYISDSFVRRRAQLETEFGDPASESYLEDEATRAEALEDRDEYAARNVFWVPAKSRWDALLKQAGQDNIGE